MSTNDAIEQEIQAKGLTAPRVTPADIEAEIEAECYFTAAQGADNGTGVMGAMDGAREKLAALDRLTFCVLILRNGFTVVGHSACASPENFNAEIGRRIARENAEREIWPLLGFRLRDQLAAS